MKYYLAIDVGTTNWKAAVFDELGNLAAIERTPTVTHTDSEGQSYYDASELWDSICKLCAGAVARAGKPIAAVSVASVAEAVAAIDRDGNTVGQIITWFDTRSMCQAKEMEQRFGKEQLYEITGLDVNPIFSLPKILWVRQNRPQEYERACCWLQMADYILYRLSGVFVTDYTLASRTLAFDIVRNCWSEEILDGVGISRDALPQAKESGTVIGTISNRISRETGITPGAKIVVGGNDHPCASIAAGVVGKNKILDSSGTAESFIYVSASGEIPEMTFRGQRICRYLQRDRYALWGGIISSGRTFDWAYETFSAAKAGGVSISDVLRELETERGVESGLLFYPHLRGAGAPHWNPRVKGAFVGLSDRHTSKNMMRSVLEGLSMQARMIVEMEEAIIGKRAQSVCVVGGSSRNILWQTIKADILQKDVELCRESEATALGAAMLAAIGDGRYGNLEEAAEFLAAKNQVIHPEPKRASVYEPWYEIYQDGYQQLQEMSQRVDSQLRR